MYARLDHYEILTGYEEGITRQLPDGYRFGDLTAPTLSRLGGSVSMSGVDLSAAEEALETAGRLDVGVLVNPRGAYDQVLIDSLQRQAATRVELPVFATGEAPVSLDVENFPLSLAKDTFTNIAIPESEKLAEIASKITADKRSRRVKELMWSLSNLRETPALLGLVQYYAKADNLDDASVALEHYKQHFPIAPVVEIYAIDPIPRVPGWAKVTRAITDSTPPSRRRRRRVVERRPVLAANARATC